MNQRAYCVISAALFSVVALVHLTRLLNGWTVQIESLSVPMMVSMVGFIVPGALALWGFREARSKTVN